MTLPAPSADIWVGVADEPLPAASIDAWARTPDCGAVVTFTGTVRDHAEGRAGVTGLTYEAYEEHAAARIAEVVAEARRRWPAIGRVAAVHRTGDLEVGDDAVIVVVASPHRAEAFAAAAYVIDTVKETVPIWKRETWADGQSWGVDAVPIRDVDAREPVGP